MTWHRRDMEEKDAWRGAVGLFKQQQSLQMPTR